MCKQNCKLCLKVEVCVLPEDIAPTCPCGGEMQYFAVLYSEDEGGYLCPDCGKDLADGEDFEPEAYGVSPPTYNGLAW